MESEQKNAKLFETACTADAQQPVSGISKPTSTDFKTATKRDQFRKMKDYHNNVIQYPFAHQQTLAGPDAVKYLEHRLQKV